MNIKEMIPYIDPSIFNFRSNISKKNLIAGFAALIFVWHTGSLIYSLNQLKNRMKKGPSYFIPDSIAKMLGFCIFPVQKYLGGPADHTIKTYIVTFVTEFDANFLVKVGTWNLMDRCHKPTNYFGNNPFDYNELDAEYIFRKQQQIAMIKEQIQNQDVFAMQEIDFISCGQRALINRNAGIPLRSWEPSYLEVYEKFLQMLKDCERELLTTDPNITNNTQTPLAILYNPEVLHYNEAQGPYLKSIFPQNQQCRGAEATFKHVVTQRRLTITNVHLKQDQPNQQTIETYQARQITDNSPTIILGDFNTHPDDLNALIAHPDHPTNIDAILVSDRGNPSKLSDKDSKDRKKVCDGACVSPDSRTFARILEGPATTFRKKAAGHGFDLFFINPQLKYETEKGMAFRNT